MSGRLGGGERILIKECDSVSKLHIHRMPTMTNALALSKRRIWQGHSAKDGRVAEWVGNVPVDGDPARLAKAMGDSEALLNETITYDPRLAKKALWLRRDEGEHCDSALLAEGDDQPFYKRFKNIVNDATMAGEPLRIVVSTDDNKVPDGAAAAFIATVRIVQQFVPVHVWWQGAWLTEDKYKGFVFHVPLVQGDMDFSRLEFCIADPRRDSFSFRVMSTHCVLELQESWNECGHRAEISYLPEARGFDNFVTHNGIQPSVANIAYHAATWLGWEPLYVEEYNQSLAASAALQRIEPEYTYKDNRTQAQKDRDYRTYQEQAEKMSKAKAKEAAMRIVEV